MQSISRRGFLAVSATGAAATLSSCASAPAKVRGSNRPPNVLLIMTDDHGYGDIACLGNDKIKTPNIDRLHAESTRFTQYHNMPVCTPTRACLMTGRYNYRTCAIDTYRGRAMMHPDEVTVAEMFSAAGYRTGIFGKWHLGDCYPMRACDKGFQESLVIHGGGLKQASDPPGSGGYFNPILMENGKNKPFEGYCTDIFGENAVRFLEKNKEEPFFLYFPTNAPHVPLIVDEKYAAPYKAMGLDDRVAKFYGMIANIDENVGRLLQTLERLNLAQNTLVVFMTDNGAQIPTDAPRFNAGMRGDKSTVYQGGIRVPCFMRLPGKIRAGTNIDRTTAHIDITLTLLDLCQVKKPESDALDGKSLMPLLRGETRAWKDRTLFFQWHRGDKPELYRNCAARTQQYKVVNGKELYDLQADPSETTDIAGSHPDVVSKLRTEYEHWFADVSATRGYDQPKIYLGDPHSNPVYLTQQDQRGIEVEQGHWEVDVRTAGTYEALCRFPEKFAGGTGNLTVGETKVNAKLQPGQSTVTLSGLNLPAGPASLSSWIDTADAAHSAQYVDVKKV